MVTKKPTTIVQIISQSDIMRSNQNYKINKKSGESLMSQILNLKEPQDIPQETGQG